MSITGYNKLLGEETILKNKKKELIQKIEDAQSQIKKIQVQVNETQKNIKVAQVKLSGWQSKVEEARDERIRLEKEQQDTKFGPEDLEQLKAELGALSERRNESNVALETVDEFHRILNPMFNNGKLIETMENISQLTANIEGVKKEEEKLQEKLTRLERTKETAESQLIAAEKEITEIKSSRGEEIDAFLRCEREIQELSLRNKQLPEEIENGKRKLNELKAEHSKTKWGSKIAGLKEELKMEEDKLDKERKKREEIENQLAELNDEIKQKQRLLETIEKKEIPELTEISSELTRLFEEAKVSYLAVEGSILSDIVKKNLNELTKFIKEQCPVN